MLPIRSKNPPESLPIATCVLIAINTLVFFLTGDGWQIHAEILKRYGVTAQNFSPLTVGTSMFLHLNLPHLAGNMWFLYLFGFALEGRLKPVRFVILYLAAGVGGAFLHNYVIGVQYPTLPALGASGAIMGVMAATLWVFPFAAVKFYGAGFTFCLPMWIVGLYYVGLEFLWAAVTVHWLDGVGHFTHVGGALTGFVVCLLFRPRRDNAAASSAKAVYDDTKDLRTLSALELGNLAAVNPDDPVLALNWMHRSLREMRVEDRCRDHFLRVLPRMLQECEPGPVGYCVASLAAYGVPFAAPTILDAAGRVERMGDAALAVQLYDVLLRSREAEPADRQAALFRTGILAETKLGDLERARRGYREIVERHPMSPFATSAKAQLDALPTVRR